MENTDFKQCNVCKKRWPKRADLLADEELILIGYQANFVAVEKGLFLFNHSCGGTLSIAAKEFADLYDGPIYVERKAGKKECSSYCLYTNELRPCPAKCDCAYVREILQLLKKPSPPKALS